MIGYILSYVAMRLLVMNLLGEKGKWRRHIIGFRGMVGLLRGGRRGFQLISQPYFFIRPNDLFSPLSYFFLLHFDPLSFTKFILILYLFKLVLPSIVN